MKTMSDLAQELMLQYHRPPTDLEKILAVVAASLLLAFTAGLPWIVPYVWRSIVKAFCPEFYWTREDWEKFYEPQRRAAQVMRDDNEEWKE